MCFPIVHVPLCCRRVDWKIVWWHSFTDGSKSMMFEFALVYGADRRFPTVIGDGLTLVVDISSWDVDCNLL